MPRSVSDVRSNASVQIEHAVRVLGRSKQRLKIFKAIFRGKKRAKTVNEIATSTGLNRVRVLQEGKWLADNQIVRQIVSAGITAYEKDRFYSAYKDKILQLVQDPVAFGKLETKKRGHVVWPKGQGTAIRIPTERVQVSYITIDDIDSFDRVQRTSVEPGRYKPMPESQFKAGIARILGEGGQFKDWGGERQDLYTNRVRIAGRRVPCAFAFKGGGTTGILTPGKMGKNGDQIQRLFKTPAHVFLVQYWAQISDSVVDQMAEFAKIKSVGEGIRIRYGIIDGDDSNRLIKAYPRAFHVKKKKRK